MTIAAEMPPEIDPQTAAQPKRCRCLTAFSRNTCCWMEGGRGADGGTNGGMQAGSKCWENLELEGGEDGWTRREINRWITTKFEHFIA